MAAPPLALSPAPPATASPPPVAVVAQGRLQGRLRQGVAEFLGVPYAAPPVGALRWRPPRPPAPWPGTRLATRPGNRCPQWGADGKAEGDEDCLVLNVHAPARRGARLRPVMVWIHGGSWAFGSGDDYDGIRLAARGFVVVTINYRLGPLGFLALPSLSAEAPDHASGQYGLMDQRAALRWVRQNARAFGGDPDNVTIFGESAGGVSVCQQVASPKAAGLFQRAIAQSGCSLRQPTLAMAENAGGRFAPRLGCADPATAAACLRAKPVQDLNRPDAPDGLWTPPVGGEGQPRQVLDAFRTGAYDHVPIIQGTNHDEGNYFVVVDYPYGIPASDYRNAIAHYFGAGSADRIEAAYPLWRYPHPATLWALGAALTDAQVCAAYQADMALARWTPVYAYEFADPRPGGVDPNFPGAVHGAELGYIFQRPIVGWVRPRPFTRAQWRLSDEMVRYWTRFAGTGRPDGWPDPVWPRFTLRAPLLQELTPAGTGPVPGSGFLADHNCRFWLGSPYGHRDEPHPGAVSSRSVAASRNVTAADVGVRTRVKRRPAPPRRPGE